MSNMSYCRFENTARDLQDCADHWDDVSDEDLSSDHERRGKKHLKETILEMAEQFAMEDDDDSDTD
jgi:hypothetical protein